MNIYTLRYFVTVADKQSIDRASAALYISRQTLSADIKRLEERLGVSLFLRKYNGVELTEEGKKLYDYAVRILDLWEEAENKVHPENAVSEVCRAAINSFLFWSFNDDLSRFEEMHPGSELRFLSMSMQDCNDALLADEVDIAIMPFGSFDRDIAAVPVVQLPRYILINKDDPLSELETFSWKDLRGQTFLNNSNEKTILMVFGQDALPEGCRLRRVPNDLFYVQKLLERGAGVFTVFGAAAEKLKTDRLKLIPCSGEMADVNVHILRRKTHKITRLEKELEEFIAGIK